MTQANKRAVELADRLRQLESARGVMDDTVLDALLAETRSELEGLEADSASDADLGAEVSRQGPIRASGGSVVITGDASHLVIVTGDGERIAASDAGAELLYEAYLAALAADCCQLPLGVIDTQFVRAGSEHAVKLPEVYVELDVTAASRPADDGEEREWAWRLVRGEASDRTRVLEALVAGKGRRYVLLGDPGSGKTTFTQFLSHALARDPEALPEKLRGLVPIRFLLREVAARHIPAAAKRGTARMLWDALHESLADSVGDEGAKRLRPHFEQLILSRGAFVVLDGLDEVPEARRRRKVLLEAVAAFAAELREGGSRFLVTARPYAYADPRWHLEGFEILALAPFSREQVERFIGGWYHTAARRAFGWSEETARAGLYTCLAPLSGPPFRIGAYSYVAGTIHRD